MDTHFEKRLTALEAKVADMTHGNRSAWTNLAVGEATPSVVITTDGKRAVGRNGLDIEYRGSDSCPYGRSATQNRRNFEAVIIHHTADDHSTDWYVQYQIDGDPGRGGHHFGYHFYISPTGEIIQGAPLTKRTNHVKGSMHAKRRAVGRHANNTNAIGISCVGAGKPSFQPTAAQSASAEALAHALCVTIGIDPTMVYGHGEIQTDRHSSEGASVAETIRSGRANGTVFSTSDEDLDDDPIHDMMMAGSFFEEESEDLDSTAFVLQLEAPDRAIGTPALNSTAATRLLYTNQSAIRNRKCTDNLERRLVEAVEAVYGKGCTINIYSGGQHRKGVGTRRTGSIRHDDYGNGGRAADVHVFDQSGNQIKALELAKVGQFWLASGFGCVGHEMKGGGIHLDEWTQPPPGGSRFWTYAYSNNLPWGPVARRMLEKGAQGTLP